MQNVPRRFAVTAESTALLDKAESLLEHAAELRAEGRKDDALHRVRAAEKLVRQAKHIYIQTKGRKKPLQKPQPPREPTAVDRLKQDDQRMLDWIRSV